MIYFLYGANSYHALRKTHEFKEAFAKKSELYLIEELDGEILEINEEKFSAALGQGNLFSKTRLVIFKNIFTKDEKTFEIIKERGGSLKESKDIFVFWERDPAAKILSFFKKYSEKTQEVE